MTGKPDLSGNNPNRLANGTHQRDARYFGDYFLDIARGAIPEVTIFDGFGEGDALNGDNLDIWNGPTDSQPEPIVTGYQPSIVSSSIEDAIGGNGVSEVEIHYLNTAGIIKEEHITLTGTTPVAMIATDVMFINRMHATQLSGIGLVAAGNIDAVNGATVMVRISIATNQTLTSMKQVPANKILFVDGWHCEGIAATTKTARVRLRATTHRPTFENLPGIYSFIDVAGVKDAGTGWLPFRVPVIVAPLSTIKVSAWTSGSINLTTAWRGHIEDFPI